MPGTVHEPVVPDRPQVSVVIPFLNEEKALPATLAALAEQEGEFEIVAVDAGSSDASRAILAAAGVPVIDAHRGRAAQMNAGASAAQGTLFLFLHADTLLPPGALRSLTLAAAAGPVWGGFRHRFSGDDWRLRLVSRLTNLRCRITGVVYGDQALFASRELFDAAGGFPEEAMEDIALSERLKRLQPPLLLADAVVTDARKFLRMGVWRSLTRVVLVLACRQLRLPYPTAFFSDIR
jgi:rSAM/selenodomain-associated transferase 2